MTRLRTGLERIRLLDALVLAAIAMLTLKVIGLAGLSTGTSERARAARAADEPPPFAQVLTHARTNFVPGSGAADLADPATTGSVPDAPKPATAPEPPAPPRPEAIPFKEEPGAARPASTSERAILERLGDRRGELERRAREMDARERLVVETEKRLDARAGDAKGPDEKAEEAATKRATAEAAGLKNLVTMYETMKPKEAARVFDRLPADVLLPVVTGIAPRKMAEIMAAMSPEGAEKLTVALASRARGGTPADRRAVTPGLPAGELPAIDLVAPVRRPGG